MIERAFRHADSALPGVVRQLVPAAVSRQNGWRAVAAPVVGKHLESITHARRLPAPGSGTCDARRRKMFLGLVSVSRRRTVSFPVNGDAVAAARSSGGGADP